jgi:pilus assembly protein CpaE
MPSRVGNLLAVIISPDIDLSIVVEVAIEEFECTIFRVNHYPDLSDLQRLHEASDGCVAFVDFDDAVKATAIASELETYYPNVRIIAIQGTVSRQDLISFMELGVRDAISKPVFLPEARDAFRRVAARMRASCEREQGQIYAFCPAKPGVGATTIVTNAAAAFARISKQPAVLLDLDLRLGITSFLLRLDGRYSIQDAIRQGARLDPQLWANLVSRWQNLDVLGSAPVDLVTEAAPQDLNSVLDTAQLLYGSVFVDLSGAFENHEVAALKRAKEVFLVCTPEVPVMHMAARKVAMLQDMQINAKISVLVNRERTRRLLSVPNIEEILGAKVRFTFPEDELSVSAALTSGEALKPGSKIADKFDSFAQSLAGTIHSRKKSTTAVRRFVDYFSVSPSWQART